MVKSEITLGRWFFADKFEDYLLWQSILISSDQHITQIAQAKDDSHAKMDQTQYDSSSARRMMATMRSQCISCPG